MIYIQWKHTRTKRRVSHQPIFYQQYTLNTYFNKIFHSNSKEKNLETEYHDVAIYSKILIFSKDRMISCERFIKWNKYTLKAYLKLFKNAVWLKVKQNLMSLLKGSQMRYGAEKRGVVTSTNHWSRWSDWNVSLLESWLAWRTIFFTISSCSSKICSKSFFRCLASSWKYQILQC